jgi:hypothetical protein
VIRYVATTAVAALIVGMLAVPASAAAPRAHNTLRAGAALTSGQSLRSPDGRYTATLGPRGHLTLWHGRRIVWTTKPTGSHPRLELRRSGNLVITSGRRTVWESRTRAARALVLRDNGILALQSSGGTVWSNRARNGCPLGAVGQRVLIDLSVQFARLCDGGRQVLATPITSGASAYGDGTPTGTWRVQDKQRDRYLYPAAGGAYYVHFWIPYDGAYGMHDSSWQHFPYGSQKYRTRGSHGCVHFPFAAIRAMYDWIRVGSLVRIQS